MVAEDTQPTASLAGVPPAEEELSDTALRRLLLKEALAAVRAALTIFVAVALVEWVVTGWVSRPTHHQTVAVLDIPRLGVHEAVVEGVGRAQTRHGVGHVPRTARPGQPGTSVVAGHSSAFGGPFGQIGQLVVGDAVNVTTANRTKVPYRVQAKAKPVGRIGLVAGDSQLVLVTGTPRFWPSKAIAVVATPVDGASRSVLPPTRLSTLVDQAALLRPSRPAQVLSVLAGVGLLLTWEVLRVWRRRHATTRALTALGAMGAALFAVLCVSVAVAFPAIF